LFTGLADSLDNGLDIGFPRRWKGMKKNTCVAQPVEEDFGPLFRGSGDHQYPTGPSGYERSHLTNCAGTEKNASCGGKIKRHPPSFHPARESSSGLV
jgi:hypothetical protein